MSSKMSSRSRGHSRKRSKSRGRVRSKGGSTRKRSTSRKGHARKSSKGKLKKSIVRRHYRGGAEVVVSSLNQEIKGDVDIIVAQDTFLIVANYYNNSICYYSIEDDPNDGKTRYVFKTYFVSPDSNTISNVAVQEIKDKNNGNTRTFLFYFIGNQLVCLEVNLKHNREVIVSKNDKLLEQYKGRKDIDANRKYIVFYKNPHTNTHNLCYTTLVGDELKFNEIALITNPSQFEIYSISMIRTLGKSDDLYSFCFISNNLMAFLISNKNFPIDLPESDNSDDLTKYTSNSDKNKYTSITRDDIKYIQLNNTRYFTSPDTYKLMYYQYNYNTISNSLVGGATTSYVAFSPNFVRYSEIQGTNCTTQKSRGMVYNNNCIYINFNNIISVFKIPPECVFNHYLTMKKLGNRLETSGWKDFVLDFDNRIEFVKKAKNYNNKKNTDGKDNNKYKTAVRSIIGPKIEEIEKLKKDKGIKDIYDKLVTRKQEEEEEARKRDEAKAKKIKEEEDKKNKKQEEARRKEEEDKKNKEEAEARRKEEARMRVKEQETNATAFKPKGMFSSLPSFSWKGGEDVDQALMKEAERLYDKTSAPLFGTKKSTQDLINTYEPTEVEIRIEELKEQSREGKEISDNSNKKQELANKIMNRYQNNKMDGNPDYNEADYKKYATIHANDLIKNSDYDFLYFDKTDIKISNAMGLTLYEDKLLTVTGTNTITAVSL